MMIRRSKIFLYWPFIAALFILTVTCSISIGGLSLMVKYDKATDEKLDYNLVNLHYFIREYIAQQYQRYTAATLPEHTVLPSFHLFVDKKDLATLEENLPESAKLQFVQSHIKIDVPEFSGEAEIRYRGGLDLHWLYKKKSLRIKLPQFSAYRNERQFNLVNPSTIHTITDWVSYDMARSIGLLTPEYFPARVFINNETNGLHFFLSMVDESFLRKNNRMPGSIYSGDTSYLVNPHIKVKQIGEVFYPGSDGLALLWKDNRLWKKNASRNSESSEKRVDIEKYLKIINEEDPLVFMEEFNTYFDKEKYYHFWGLDNLVGSYHHDLYHNHKIYFDPYKGRFEPIEWDVRFWSYHVDIPVTPLYKQILLNPLLKYEADLITHKLWKKFTVKRVNKLVDDANKVVFDELAADPYRQHPDTNQKQYEDDKVVHFSMDDYSTAIEDLKQTFKSRHNLVDQQLNLTSAYYSVEGGEEGNWSQLTIAIYGNSPVDLNPWTIVPGSLHRDIEIFRVYDDIRYPVQNNGRPDRLYPGVFITRASESTKLPPKTIAAFGLDSYSPSPMQYKYIIKGINNVSVTNTNKLVGRNAITADIVNFERVKKLPDKYNTSSLHPWKLLAQDVSEKNEIVLSGEIDVSEDRVFTEEQNVIILPGTVFKLSKNSSVFFYGKVIAEGTAESPIRFEERETGDLWGSVVLQGKKASGSVMRHVYFRGGSVASRNLIEYPGQINIHDLDSFQLHHCHISDNSIGDDALHIAYSQGEVTNCKFKNTAFDALDIDIAKVTVADSVFYNAGNDAIDLMNSEIIIENSRISGSGDKCISVGEASNVMLHDSRLEDCPIGIAIKDQSTVHIDNTKFSIQKGDAISLYQKNPHYSAGGEVYGERLYGITNEDIIVGNNSRNNIKESAYLPLTD